MHNQDPFSTEPVCQCPDCRKDREPVSAPSKRWNKPGLPHKGWEWVTVVDAGSMKRLCQMCGNRIRYCHHIQHPKVPGSIVVGRGCAGKLTVPYKGDKPNPEPKEQEELLLRKARGVARPWRKVYRPARSLDLRRQEWVEGRRRVFWKISRRGNPYFYMEGSIRIVVFRKDGQWAYVLGGKFSSRKFSSQAIACKAALQQVGKLVRTGYISLEAVGAHLHDKAEVD